MTRRHKPSPEQERPESESRKKSTTLATLRQEGRRVGLKGVSRIRRAELEALLQPVVVYRQDRKAMQWLRQHLGKEPWMQFAVAEWSSHGGGRYQRSRPRAWYVPVGLMGDLVPLTSDEADQILAQRSASGKKAAEIRQAHLAKAAMKIGARAGSRIAQAYYRGEIDEFEAELAAFKTRYRHEYTDYEAQLATARAIGLRGEEGQAFARDSVAEDPIPDNWREYLQKYEFVGDEVAEAMARVLQDPCQAHPIWFCKAMLAVKRRGNVDLSGLTYEIISECLEDWQA